MAQNRYEPLPEFIQNAPEISDADATYFEAYVKLDATRFNSLGGMGSIPWFHILQYGEYLGLDSEDLEDFVEILTIADNLVLQKVQEEQDAKQDKR